jgi:signal peptidase I
VAGREDVTSLCSRCVIAREIFGILCVIGATALLPAHAGANEMAGASTKQFYVPSSNMAPTLKIGDVITVHLLNSRPRIGRGEIVVIRKPPTYNCGGPPPKFVTERVIALPGETISLSSGNVLINGNRLNETWLPRSEQGRTSPGPLGSTSLASTLTVPPNAYFVMADNRRDSCDSRYWGTINRSEIYGQVRR